MLNRVLCCIVLAVCCAFGGVVNCADNSNSSQNLKSSLIPDLISEQKSQLIPREILFAKPDRFCVRLSPNGRYISYFSRSESEVELHIDTVDGKRQQIFKVKEARNMYGYRWCYTNNHILLPEDNQGDENDHILCLNIKTGEKKNLTPFETFGKSKSYVEELSKDFPNEAIISNNKRNAQRFDAYRVNIETGECDRVFENNAYISMIFDEKLQLKALSRILSNGDVELLTARGDVVLKIPCEEAICGRFSHFKKNSDILYGLCPLGKDKAALMSVNIKTKEIKTLFESDEADVQLASCDPKTFEPQLVCVNYLRKKDFVLTKVLSNNFSILRKKFGDKEFYIQGRSSDDSRWLIVTEESDEPVKYYLFDNSTKSVKFLFSNQPMLDKYHFQKMEPIVVKSRDGLDLVCYLTRANGSKIGQPTPLIAYIHGGPWARDFYGFDKQTQWLANRGYAVLQINYRGSSGFGKKFTNAINKNLEGVRNDIIDAVQWAIDQEIADKNKIAIMGGSFGGYSTLAGLAYTPDFFCCGVDIVGPSNFVTLLSSVPEYWKPEMVVWYKTVGNPENPNDIPYMKAVSPLFQKDKIKKPLLVFQGANDPRVAKAESDQIVAALKAKKRTVAYVLYPDEGHGFHREPNIKSYTAFSEKFLAKILGGWFEPISENELEGSTHRILEGKGIL